MKNSNYLPSLYSQLTRMMQLLPSSPTPQDGGTPWQGLDGETPLGKDWIGYLPFPRRRNSRGSTGGMPLAFTQEDFHVEWKLYTFPPLYWGMVKLTSRPALLLCKFMCECKSFAPSLKSRNFLAKLCPNSTLWLQPFHFHVLVLWSRWGWHPHDSSLPIEHARATWDTTPAAEIA